MEIGEEGFCIGISPMLDMKDVQIAPGDGEADDEWPGEWEPAVDACD